MQNIRTIVQSESNEEIAMDSLLEDPFAPIRTYQSIMTEMCSWSWSRPNIVNKNYRVLTEKSFKTRRECKQSVNLLKSLSQILKELFPSQPEDEEPTTIHL